MIEEKIVIESAEEAQQVLQELCELLQACFDIINVVDSELEEGNASKAQEIIDTFFATIEDKQEKLH